MGLVSGYRIGPRGDRRFKLEDIERFLTGRTEGGEGEAHVIL